MSIKFFRSFSRLTESSIIIRTFISIDAKVLTVDSLDDYFYSSLNRESNCRKKLKELTDNIKYLSAKADARLSTIEN